MKNNHTIPEILSDGLRIPWEERATGESGDIELEKSWLRDAQKCYMERMPAVMEEIFKIFCKKQHDYGPQNIALAGPKGVTLRMVDKFSRLWNLVGMNSNATPPVNAEEALYDTAMDLADYGIILMLTLDGSWNLMCIKDAFVLEPLKTDTSQLLLPLDSLISERMGEE